MSGRDTRRLIRGPSLVALGVTLGHCGLQV
jgi:hypothetical protein